MVNGSSSKWSPVLSSVPQATVLGSNWFLLFISDLLSSVSSRVKLFADDSVFCRHIESSADNDKLQQDLFQLKQMNFAPSKCYIMSITLKLQPSSFSYTLCNTPPEGVTFQKYLGVYITNSLNWTKQEKKANKILGVLQRNSTSCCAVVKERVYLSLVLTVWEYGSVARGSPYT